MQLLNDKIDGSGSPENVLPAVEWNQVPSELQNIITALGMTLSNGDLNQLGKALAGYAANGSFYTDSGLANAYVLTPIGGKQTPPAYTDGMEVEFIAANPNTAPSTVNVDGKGVKNIKLESGINPLLNDISGRTSLKFDSGNDWFELILGPETMTGGLASVRSVGDSDFENRTLNFDKRNGLNRGVVGFDGATDTISLKNRVHGGDLELGGENLAGTTVPFIVCNPDVNDGVVLHSKGADVARAFPASSGGFQANNTLTGVGFERVLTVSDQSIKKYKKVSTVRVSTATLADDPELAGFVLLADSVYVLNAYLLVSSGASDKDIKFALQFSSAPSYGSSDILDYDGFTNPPDLFTGIGDMVKTYVGQAGPIISPTLFRGSFATGASGATVDLQWAQNTSGASDTTLERGSFVEFILLGDK